MFLIGMPSPLVLGIVAGIFEAVPLLGPFLGAILPLLLAITGSPDKIIWVIVAVVVIQQLEGQLLVPRVMNAAVGVNPILTILIFTAFTSLLGLTGAILSVPIAAFIQIGLDRFVSSSRMTEPEQPSGRDRLSVLRLEAHDLIEDVRGQQRRKRDAPGVQEDQVLDMIESIATDLESSAGGRRRTGGDAMRQVAWFTTVALVTLSVVVLLWRFSSEVTIFVLSSGCGGCPPSARSPDWPCGACTRPGGPAGVCRGSGHCRCPCCWP